MQCTRFANKYILSYAARDYILSRMQHKIMFGSLFVNNEYMYNKKSVSQNAAI